MSKSHPWSAARVLRWTLALILVLVIAFWDWNWFRPMIERQASDALGRPLRVGHFDVDLSRHPLLEFKDIRIANPGSFPDGGDMLSLRTMWVRVNPWKYFRGTLSFDEIDLDAPVGRLEPDLGGVPNYVFPGIQNQPASQESGLRVEVLALNIADGDIRWVDPGLKADFRVHFRTRPPAEGGEPILTAEAEGRYADQPVSARLKAGSLLSLREAGMPYPVELRVANGPTEAVLIGSIDDPLSFGGANVTLDFKGQDLADLFPLTGVPLPPTAPFHVVGKLDYHDPLIRFSDFTGTIGSSDLSGDVAVDPSGPQRRRISMKLRSQRLVLADLGGFIGAEPGKANTQDSKSAADDDASEQKQAQAAPPVAARKRLLPDTPINLPRLNAADLDVRYQAKRIASEQLPVDDLEAHLILEEGIVRLEPLNFGVSGGSIVSTVALDGRQSPVRATASIDIRQLDLKRILEKATPVSGAGKIGGSARIDTRGNSLADMLGRGNGELKLFMSGGDLSALLVNLMGLDLGNSLIAALGLPRRAELRCMVSDFALRQGTLDTRTMLVDTSEANVIGSGQVHFGDETLAYDLRTEPKRLNIGSVAAPIHIRGSFAEPSIRPDVGALGVRGTAMVALGAVLTPLAALIPTLQLGLGEDNDCKALIAQAQNASSGQPASTPPPKPKPKP